MSSASPGATDRKPTRRAGRKAPTLRPESNTSVTAVVRVVMLKTTSSVLKGGYHECVSNVKYAVVSLTTLQREQCFVLSERNPTSPLVTSRISRECRTVTTYQFITSSS